MDVKTAARTIDLFEAFAEHRRPLTLTELARALAIPASSCLGLVRTLAGRGYLYEIQRRNGFYPTGRLYARASIIAAHDPLLERVRPTLEALRDATAESVVFGKMKETRILYLDYVPSPQSVRYIAEAGDMRPPHANSLGKAILGAMDRADRLALLSKIDWQRFTSRTAKDLAALEADLDASRERGWYANLGESIADLGAIASPVRVGGEWFAVSVVGPLNRIEASIVRHALHLCAARDALDAVFGADGAMTLPSGPET
ncbi:IclR family transcriptional regulator [Acidiphilium sp. AL]|uniref:IclR family transcriptional regulator n=1 Tax=Acidiphilium iwatense TaxID=768198 RepID=A0ABS9DWX3_9PROT|nr:MULTISPECIES: IclR family transcriptional regulator [Acidiphilium]MCF3945957.1 IclR family transcriptional regulator [Acidiphilium iwatense]MCU4159162.1 IclR family transcriptional regulator [Acidiphilium sp. AL]